jgi:integrase
VSIYKRGGVYWYKFMWKGEMVRESTKQGNDKVARQMESAHRTSLAQGEVGLREKKPVSTLAEFLKKDYLPFVEAEFAAKPKTANYYAYGAALLLKSDDLGGKKLDEITSQHGAGFMARNSRLSPSTINCGLRTLRRALKLAAEWGKLPHAPKITLARGERQRERVVTEQEFSAYRDLCRQPWRDVVTLLHGTGMRPGEAYRLRWEDISLNGRSSLVRIAFGKSKAARRVLPMVAEVYEMLRARWKAEGTLRDGWIFPAGSASGHLEESTAKIQHGDALRKLAAAHAAHKDWEKNGRVGAWGESISLQTGLESCLAVRHAAVIKSGLKSFEPYCLRHTALTRLAEAGCDAFTLPRIAGHSSIIITQRYCHPQADAIYRAFGKLSGGHNFGHTANLQLVNGETEIDASAQAPGGLSGERGRNRTFNLLIKSQLGFNRPCSSNSQLTNNLQESCAHREPLPNA